MTITTDNLSEELVKIDEQLNQKKYNEAVKSLRKLLRTYPDSAEIHAKLGNLLSYSQSTSLAKEHLEKAITLSPDNHHYWAHLANFYIHMKDEKEAMRVYEESLKYHKDNHNILFILASLYKRAEAYEKAYDIIVQLLKEEPENVDYALLYGELLPYFGKGEEAVDQYNSLIKTGAKELPEIAYLKWYELMESKKRLKDAGKTLEDIIESGIDNPTIYHLYAMTLLEEYREHDAYDVVKNALERHQNSVHLINTMGMICRRMGEIEQAEKYIEQILDLEPFNAGALHQYAVHGKAKYGNKYFNRVVFAGSNIANMQNEQRTYMFYALAKVFDDVGDLPTAFEYYRKGGIAYLKDKKSEIPLMRHLLKLYKEHFDQDFIEAHQKLGSQSKKPVFILGMPRSGTTLMEQVLSSINGVAGAGELTFMRTALEGIHLGEEIFSTNEKTNSPLKNKADVTILERADYYMEQVENAVSQDAERIIDKMPANFSWLGLILLLFPNASILHSRRHPIEVCLSAYRILFAGGQIWSYDLKEMGKYYRIYWEMMKFWKEILPEGSILDVYYENMVDDLEYESKRLAEFIEMPWNEKCLAFHKSDKVVKTASITQVRKPIYKTSVNRWQKYAPYLQPLIEEIPDLIEEYEKELAESRKAKQ